MNNREGCWFGQSSRAAMCLGNTLSFLLTYSFAYLLTYFSFMQLLLSNVKLASNWISSRSNNELSVVVMRGHNIYDIPCKDCTTWTLNLTTLILTTTLYNSSFRYQHPVAGDFHIRFCSAARVAVNSGRKTLVILPSICYKELFSTQEFPITVSVVCVHALIA